MRDIDQIINTELLFRMAFRMAAYNGEEDGDYKEAYLKFCSSMSRKVVSNRPDQKIQYSIGVIPAEKKEKKLLTEIYYDLSKNDWCFEIIMADTLAEVIPLVNGEYFYVIKIGDELCLMNLFSIYEIMKSNPNVGGYIFGEKIKETSYLYEGGGSAFSAIFLKSEAENNMIYNMAFMRQLNIAEWLGALSRDGNMYVTDYGASCCAYLISLVSSVIEGNKKPGNSSNTGEFQFKYKYVDGIIELLNQWTGLIDDSIILNHYKMLVDVSFHFLELKDNDVYISDTQIEQVRDYLLNGVERLLIEWPYNGIRFQKVYIRKKYTEFIKKPRLSRVLEEWFYIQSGYRLELENPRTFNQKINWIKLYDNRDIKTTLSDKYAVRAWVAEKIGEKYLLPLINVWDNVEEINFSNLPDKFVLKVNQGSGFNIVVTDKTKINENEIRKQLNEWMHTDYFTYGLELQYRNIKPKVICEEYVENSGEGLHDYKVHVFNGKPQYVQYISGRTDKSQTAERWYDIHWQPLEFSYTNPKAENIIERPQCLDELLKVAENLGSEFAYVRVDMYILNSGQIKFGEMTFTPTNGMDPWKPAEMDLIMGNKIDIEALRKNISF